VSGPALLKRGPREQIRGGFSLTERDGLWAASLKAVRHQPVAGSGLGTDAPPLAPYPGPQFAVYTGISSHSGWLRTAVEMGIVGLLLLAGIWAAVLWLTLTALRRRRALLGSPTVVALLALALAFLADQSFEVYLLGGLGLPNLLSAVTVGMLA